MTGCVKLVNQAKNATEKQRIFFDTEGLGPKKLRLEARRPSLRKTRTYKTLELWGGGGQVRLTLWGSKRTTPAVY